MGEFFRKITGQLKTLWGKWSLVQKLILLGIGIAAIVGIIVLFSVSSSPTMAPVIDTPIRDENLRDRIVTRINLENVKTTVSPAGIVMVENADTARRMRSILIREDLIPAGTDPWEIFDRERWTITDFERNVNLRRAITQMVTDHIRALDDIDNVSVTIVSPERQVFSSDQNPVTASVIITPKPGSDITENRKKIEGIQKILKFAIEGLKDENIVIADYTGLVLNDFTGMENMDWLAAIDRGNKMIRDLENRYRATVLSALQSNFGADQVRDLNIKIDMDLSKKAVTTEEYFPITLKERTPGLAYDDSESATSITRSKTQSNTTWEGTGYNPEGPAGVEGQTAPAFRDMSNLYGKVTQETLVDNEEINKRVIQEERSPSIDRITVSVNIDGTWKIKYDEDKNPIIAVDGSLEREYIPVSPETLRNAQALIQNAIGYNAARGDSVTVTNIPINREAQFKEEDTAFFKAKQFRITILIFLGGLVFLLLIFILFRAVSREIERRRRLAEEDRARREQALRESALMQVEEQDANANLSVEERSRLEMMENITNMAKGHPEDVAQLIRTWLLEE
ncbi:MAG: flagellar M-ring protein FliF [Spirochaetaceae bacterium]|nr:flagellar M-ring protein FliF [Spirochaetaceae bacterium]